MLALLAAPFATGCVVRESPPPVMASGDVYAPPPPPPAAPPPAAAPMDNGDYATVYPTSPAPEPVRSFVPLPRGMGTCGSTALGLVRLRLDLDQRLLGAAADGVRVHRSAVRFPGRPPRLLPRLLARLERVPRVRLRRLARRASADVARDAPRCRRRLGAPSPAITRGMAAPLRDGVGQLQRLCPLRRRLAGQRRSAPQQPAGTAGAPAPASPPAQPGTGWRAGAPGPAGTPAQPGAGWHGGAPAPANPPAQPGNGWRAGAPAPGTPSAQPGTGWHGGGPAPVRRPRATVSRMAPRRHPEPLRPPPSRRRLSQSPLSRAPAGVQAPRHPPRRPPASGWHTERRPRPIPPAAPRPRPPLAGTPAPPYRAESPPLRPRPPAGARTALAPPLRPACPPTPRPPAAAWRTRWAAATPTAAPPPHEQAPHPSTATPGAGRPAPTPVRTNPNNKKK